MSTIKKFTYARALRAVSSAVVLSVFVAVSISGVSSAVNGTVVVDTFPDGADGKAPKGWKVFSFSGNKKQTAYSLKKEGDGYCVVARSSSSASAIYKEMKLDAKDTPVLRWRWKVDGIIKNGDETKKEGDDYAARVYVAFEYEPQKATFFEKIARTLFGVDLPGRAISYIWANRLDKGQAAKNPFTDKVVMIAVESGSGSVGRWISEERNVYEDYRRHFNDEEGNPLEPPGILGVAIMTDTDNTKEEAVAYFDDIVFATPAGGQGAKQ